MTNEQIEAAAREIALAFTIGLDDKAREAGLQLARYILRKHADKPITPAATSGDARPSEPVKRVTEGVRDMLAILESPDATEDEKDMAASTIVEAVAPDIMEKAYGEATWDSKPSEMAEGEGRTDGELSTRSKCTATDAATSLPATAVDGTEAMLVRDYDS